MSCGADELNLADLGQRINILVRAGVDMEPLQFSLENPDGSLVDVSGATVLAQIRKNVGDVAPAAQFVVAVEAPLVKLALPAAVVATLQAGVDARDAAGLYGWDCRIVFPDTSARWLAWGELRIVQAYTRAT